MEAVYTVKENGKESYFYTYAAGGWSYPFEVAKWLLCLDRDVNQKGNTRTEPLCVAGLLDQLKGDKNFPEPANGVPLFRAIRDTEAITHMETVPEYIEIDIEKELVPFEFNKNYPELALPKMVIPVYGYDYFSGQSILFDSAKKLQNTEKENIPLSEAKELLFELAIQEFSLNQQETNEFTMEQQMNL